MKKRYLLLVSILVVFTEVLVSQSGFLDWIPLVLIFGWIAMYYYEVRFIAPVIIIMGVIVELLSFSEVGTYAMSFSTGLLVVYIAYKYLNFSDKSYNLVLNITGLVVSILVYNLILLMTFSSFHFLEFLLSLVSGIIIFYLISKIFKKGYYNKIR